MKRLLSSESVEMEVEGASAGARGPAGGREASTMVPGS